MRFTFCLLFVSLLSNVYSLMAQPTISKVQVERRIVSQRIADDAVIYDSTGRRMKLAEFAELNRAEPGGHRLLPEYNEYGKPAFYFYRPATKEERETRRFVDRHPKLSPKPGQAMPPFVMQGTDGKEYRLTDLAGKNVILSFWTTLHSPGINSGQVERLAQQIKPYIQAGKLVSLGVTNDMPDELLTLSGTQTLPFIPVGDGRGFGMRYHITRFPTVLVIDKTGTVVANVRGMDMDSLGGILEKLR